MTLDVYGHLFPTGDASAEMEAAERAFYKQHECNMRADCRAT